VLRRLATLLVLLGALATPSASAATSLGDFQLTYYWFAAESGFVGQKVAAPGVAGKFAEDFLYSARGVPMEGTGTALSGAHIHYAGTNGGFWVTKAGKKTVPGPGGWSNGAPYWREGGWRNAAGGVTFQRADGSWVNGAGVGTKRAYHDIFGPDVGTNVTEWRSIATDLSVIPRGTSVYVPRLAGSPAHGCFHADDTGGAIIGKHIDVFIPQGTLTGLPTSSEVQTLGPGEACPPLTGPKPVKGVALRYVAEARERDFRGSRMTVPGLALRARTDFLFGAKGAAMRGGGLLPARRRIVLVDRGGWWVNARGKRTDRRANGTWTHGLPVWREGGWRNRRGSPTYQRPNGSWSNGRGVTLHRYHDRFRLARDDERVPWQAVAAPSTIAPRGARIAVTGLVSTGCLFVDRSLRHAPGALEILVPHGADLTGLPHQADITVLPANTPCVE
jgi:3D (Asp-Asp-Asp) domain-containing protein